MSSLLWSITPPNGGQTSYLFGTMHIFDGRVHEFSGSLSPYIEQCEVFSLEYDLAEGNAAAWKDAVTLTTNQRLPDMLGTSTWKRLLRLNRKLEVFQEAELASMLPFQVSSMLSLTALPREMQHSLDEALYFSAKAQGLTITGLESFEEELEVLALMPHEDSVRSIKQAVTHYSTFRKKVECQVERYVQQRLQEVYLSAKKDIGKQRQILLYDRNLRMAERMARIAEGRPIFVAVGAAHLPGGKGMLHYLKRMGFSVKPVFEWHS